MFKFNLFFAICFLTLLEKEKGRSISISNPSVINISNSLFISFSLNSFIFTFLVGSLLKISVLIKLATAFALFIKMFKDF